MKGSDHDFRNLFMGPMAVGEPAVKIFQGESVFVPQGKPEELNEILASIESSGGETWFEHEVPVGYKGPLVSRSFL